MGLMWSSVTAASSSGMTTGGVDDGPTTQPTTPQANERTQEDEILVVVDALIAFVTGKIARHFRSMIRATKPIKNFTEREGFWVSESGPGSQSTMSVEGYKNYICRMAATKLQDHGAFKVGRRPPDGQAILRQTLDRQIIGRQTHKRATLAQSTLDPRKPTSRPRERPTRMVAALPQQLYRASLEQRDGLINEVNDQKVVKQESFSE